ncbi:DNA primase large subunit [Danio aesculapii]|uniref:DNA primase large subunit n=1 Tax=Danio aesculapii TaxID=1142201 RepID=UPI0024C00419|nr:DNA primase large subunit [Danio aesculapii]
MQFSGRKKKQISSSQSDLYDHCLQFYGQPPLDNISLIEFETFAVERLKLLKTVENLGVSYVKTTDQYIKKLEAEFSSLNFPFRAELDDRKVPGGTSEYEKRRKDHISHFILRLAYCQTEDLRRWFIQQEMDLFRYRFGILPSKHKTEFLNKNNLKYETVSAEEKKNLKDKLINSSYGLSGITLEEYEFYRVPFQDALDLVRTRKVYLLAGSAYIPQHEIITIVLNDYRTRLSKALAMTARSLPAVQSDERLQPLLSHLSHAYVGQDYSIQKNVGKISLEQIDSLSGKSFPLCMRHLHKALRENHHLRHGGRMQYGLFLKGIGLTLEQAMQFWRSEFVKGKVDADKMTARSLPAVQSDERLQPLLSHLSHAYVGQDYSIQKNVGKISLEQIDSLSGKSFPLCMRHLHKALRENHHLRHGGRMQYGLFLKGIGLTLEQAMQFWRSEFVKGKVDADKFDKAYAYSIRHMFGKEGKRTDYTPYSCMKVILSNPPSQGDYHGCPFRHSDPELLKQKLQSYKIAPSGINQILELVKGMHYQLACQKYFELTHSVEDAGFSLNHPNQYFTESQKLLGGGQGIKKEVEMSQKSQENPPSASRPSQANPIQAQEEMGDLDSFFQDE